MEHKTLVDAVVTAEWEMFSNVQNVGGKASCQMDPKTFRIMRSSQLDNWDDELLSSYLEDLLNKAVEKAREIIEEKSLDNKIPVLSLSELVLEQAEKVKAPCIRPARQKTGSTDFGNVMRHVPGTCIRVAFVPEGAAAHSQEYLDAGKTEAAHNAVVYGAKILALTGAQLIENPEKLEAIKKEFHENLAKELHGQS